MPTRCYAVLRRAGRFVAGFLAAVAGIAERLASLSSELARVEDRLQRLQRTSLDLTAAMSLEEVVAVIDVLDAPVAAPARGLWLCQPGSQVLELVAQRGMAVESADRFRMMPLSGDLPGAVAARERRTVISRGPSDAVEQFAALHDVIRSTSGFLAVPMFAHGSCLGVLGVGVNEQVDAVIWPSSRRSLRRSPRRSCESD
jgi:signal transduction protein with GAF and PtsI domain